MLDGCGTKLINDDIQGAHPTSNAAYALVDRPGFEVSDVGVQVELGCDQTLNKCTSSRGGSALVLTVRR